MKMLTLSLLSLAALATGLFLSGCTSTSYSMVGGWIGDIDCGTPELVKMEWEMREDGTDRYEGDGKFYWDADYYYEWNFDIQVTHPGVGTGAESVVLDVDFSSCEEIDTGPDTCPNTDATWYLEIEEIEGDLRDFFNDANGSPVDCTFLLE